MSDSSLPSGADIPDLHLHYRLRRVIRARNGIFWISVVAAACLLLALIALSPFALAGISGASSDWNRQTYGAASAVLSGVALVGISASLAAQVRQVRADRIRTVRERHTELLQLIMNEPDAYAPIMVNEQTLDGFSGDPRRFFFTTLYVNYVRLGDPCPVTGRSPADQVPAPFRGAE
jgi:hypothetical protein